MLFNKGALSFVKISNKLNKDEMFALGYIIGTQDNIFSVIKKNTGESDYIVNERVKNIFTHETIEGMWDRIAVELELDLRDFNELEISKNL